MAKRVRTKKQTARNGQQLIEENPLAAYPREAPAQVVASPVDLEAIA